MSRNLMVKFHGGPWDGQWKEIEVPAPQFVFYKDAPPDPDTIGHYEQDDNYRTSPGFAHFKWVEK